MHASVILTSLVALIGLTVAGRTQDTRPSAAPAQPAEHNVPSEWTAHPNHPANANTHSKRQPAEHNVPYEWTAHPNHPANANAHFKRQPAEHNVPSEWNAHPNHPANAKSHSKRGALGMYECHSKNWYGPCTWTKADGGDCHNWIYGPAGSMGPDNGLTCTIYDDFNCRASAKAVKGFNPPGIPDYQANQWLAKEGLDGPMSYKCQKK